MLSQTRHCTTSCSSFLYDQDQAVTEGSVGPATIEAVVVSVNVNINVNAGSKTLTVKSTVYHFTEWPITECT